MGHSLLLDCFVVQSALDSATHHTTPQQLEERWQRRTQVSRRNSTSPTSWPRSSAPRRERKSRVLSAPSVCGPTSRRRISRIPRTSSGSPPTHHGTHLRNRGDQVFQHVQVPEGPPHQPRQINEEPDQSDIANYSDFNFPIFDLIN